ncbi:MAG TPA: hypothetical protein VLL76_02205, partial [Candidatus Omnitrophota bacterium]|nr:hypothetical protein [Candidatus Omnitrophota bacterium]
MRGVRIVAALLSLLALSSCYIPDKFRSELRLSRFGDYALSYEGELVYAPIMHDYVQGKITPENEQTRNDNIYKDLIRDPAFKSVERAGKGRFKVRYERTGRLGKVQLSAILRRDAKLLSLKSTEDGGIIVDANGVKPADAQRMAELGIGMEGEFRVTTDGKIVKHNATEVRSFGQYNVYVWKIENPLSPSPFLVMLRD